MIRFHFHNEFQLAGYVFLLSAEWLQRVMAERYLVDLIEAMSYVRRAGCKVGLSRPGSRLMATAIGYSYMAIPIGYVKFNPPLPR